ncbi:hypothetical protein ABH931_007782 [Streptacidiphilus sp. MAP12-33]|uniref:PqqD family protein n=1 Tax=Streptacidiphilus sp. MAP12-33 TaxID=3156266 RepID=UPI0035167EB1
MTAPAVLDPTATPRRCLGVRIRRVRGELLLGVGPQSLALSDVAELIYTRADGSRSLRSIAEEVAREYGIAPEEALVDVGDFVADLVALGVVTC